MHGWIVDWHFRSLFYTIAQRIDVFFYFGHFYVLNVFSERFFYLKKKRWQSSEINKKRFQNNSNEIDLCVE